MNFTLDLVYQCLLRFYYFVRRSYLYNFNNYIHLHLFYFYIIKQVYVPTIICIISALLRNLKIYFVCFFMICISINTFTYLDHIMFSKIIENYFYCICMLSSSKSSCYYFYSFNIYIHCIF